ncbi:MAG: sulfite exporter TauE/SafE family protein [Bacteroidota bacterium]
MSLFFFAMLGTFFGVNFGGANLIVMPVLLVYGVSPVVALSSTRPGILAQACIGMRLFREFSEFSIWEQVILTLAGAAGGLLGIQFISMLDPAQAEVFILIMIALFSGAAGLKWLFMKPAPKAEAQPKRKTHPWYIYLAAGFFPAIIAGLVGVGAGLIFVAIMMLGLGKGTMAASYALKCVSIGQASALLIWGGLNGQIDLALVGVLLPASLIGSYLGARFTLRMNPNYMYVVIILTSLLLAARKLGWLDFSG